jgi:hypothetical protein
MEMLCVGGSLLLMKKLGKELFSWRAHWMLASLISDWQRLDLRTKMKKAGIKPRHQPLLSRLNVLPFKWMVLSAVMISMWGVSMAGHMPVVPPVPLFDVAGCVCFLLESKPPRKPPDPQAQALALHPSADNLIVIALDVLAPQWRHQLIGVASDGASAISGCVQGTCTHLERECHNPIFNI